MPRLDGTGPLGKGRKTGRKMGLCQPTDNIQAGPIQNRGPFFRKERKRLNGKRLRNQGR